MNILMVCLWKTECECPQIRPLVSGVFDLRPPKPRYMFVWDVKQVLDFLKEKFGDND